jgi:hypothetical protein
MGEVEEQPRFISRHGLRAFVQDVVACVVGTILKELHGFTALATEGHEKD